MESNSFNMLGDFCTEIDENLDVALDELFSGKRHSKEELLKINCFLNFIQSNIVYLADLVEACLKREKRSLFVSKMLFLLGMVCTVILFCTGGYLFAILVSLIQYKVLKKSESSSNFVFNYLYRVGTKGQEEANRLSNYMDVLNTRIKKSMDVKKVLDEDEVKNKRFDIALEIVSYIINGYEIDEADDEIISMVKCILKDGGAKGESLSELTSSIRNVVMKANGGKPYTKIRD